MTVLVALVAFCLIQLSLALTSSTMVRRETRDVQMQISSDASLRDAMSSKESQLSNPEVGSILEVEQTGNITVHQMTGSMKTATDVRRRREGLYWYGVSTGEGATSRLPNYKYREIQGPISWAFDHPVEPGATWESDCLGLLMHHLTTAEKIIWASYKPTHPEVASILNSNSRSWGIYDGNYCTDCEEKYGYDREGVSHRRRRISRRRWTTYKDNSKVKAIRMPVYKESSSRKWFVMHHKFAILDYDDDSNGGVETGLERVVTGSFNWNEGAAKDNYESIIQITSRPIAAAFYKEYKHAKYNLASNTALEATASYPANPGPVVDGDVTAAFNQHCADLLVERIEAAQDSILVAVWTMSPSSSENPNKVYDALLEAAESGINVQVLTDEEKAEGREYGSMEVRKVHLDSGHFHHKFMVIDGHTVAVGSFNYVTKALSGNYENIVVINSRPVGKSFANHWHGMWNKFA